jgi:glycosyltransferase involved in cell wall biosynthesis
MRIGLVVTGGVPRTGREHVVPVLLWLIERLARRHEVHVFALHYYREPCSYSLLGATVHDVGRVDAPAGLRRFRLRSRLAAAVAAHGPFDVLHAHLGVPSMLTAVVAARIGVPSVLSPSSGEFVAIDDIGYGLQRRWPDRRALARAARLAARVTVDTAYMATLAREHGVEASVIPFGIDAGAFPPVSRSDGPPWRLLRVASLNAVKDYPALFQALAILLDRGVDLHLDIVGEDTMGGAMQRLAHALGVGTHVTFHGFQPTDRLPDFYARSHVHVSSSIHEASGIVMLEAAATGLISVGTAVGYLADWSFESAASAQRAIAVPVRAPAMLADAIGVVLGDRALRERVGTAARDWTLAHDADWTAQQFEAVYAEVSGSR